MGRCWRCVVCIRVRVVVQNKIKEFIVFHTFSQHLSNSQKLSVFLGHEFFFKKKVDSSVDLAILSHMHIDSDKLNDTLRSKLYTWAAGHFLSGWDQTMSGLELESVLSAYEDSPPELLKKQEEILLWGNLDTGNTIEDCNYVDELIWTLIHSLGDIVDILPEIHELSKISA